MDEASDAATFSSAMRAVLVLPTTAALVVPLLIGAVDPWRGAFWLAGLAPVLVGVIVVFRTVRDFFVVGRGTLAPWDPPRRLVTVGLFGWCRNPMYVGVIVTVCGMAATMRSALVAGYAVVVIVVFHARVVRFEEPWTARTFPGDWAAYCERVPRWPRLGRRSPLS